LRDTVGLKLSESRFAQSAAEVREPTMTAGNFRCRSIRSINILASDARSLSIALIHDVALTVIGTPLTWFVIATVPVGNWAKACDPKRTANDVAQQSALMAQPSPKLDSPCHGIAEYLLGLPPRGVFPDNSLPMFFRCGKASLFWPNGSCSGDRNLIPLAGLTSSNVFQQYG